MHCQQCGVEVAAEGVFCHKCGARLDGAGARIADDPPPAESPADRFAAAAAPAPPEDPEEQLWEGRYCWRAMIGTFVLAGLLTVVAIVAAATIGIGGWWMVLLGVIALGWVVLYLRLLYRQVNFRYRLSNQRFQHESGILRRVTDRIEVIDMDDVTFEQGPVERMVGVGTVRVTSSDRTHPELVLVGIDDVKRVAMMIDDARRTERRRRGLHIEAI